MDICVEFAFPLGAWPCRTPSQDFLPGGLQCSPPLEASTTPFPSHTHSKRAKNNQSCIFNGSITNTCDVPFSFPWSNVLAHCGERRNETRGRKGQDNKRSEINIKITREDQRRLRAHLPLFLCLCHQFLLIHETIRRQRRGKKSCRHVKQMC